MINMASTEIKLLDMARAYGVGSDAVLIPLDHSPDRGYFPLSIQVPGGWTIELGVSQQLQTLVIIENDFVDADLLIQVRAFSVDGRIYEIVSGYKIQSPEPNSPTREWQFPVAPTGEVYP